jgi:hypothetical protein
MAQKTVYTDGLGLVVKDRFKNVSACAHAEAGGRGRATSDAAPTMETETVFSLPARARGHLLCQRLSPRPDRPPAPTSPPGVQFLINFSSDERAESINSTEYKVRPFQSEDIAPDARAFSPLLSSRPTLLSLFCRTTSSTSA